MLHYAVIFFVIAIIAAVLGARGVAGMSAQIGYVLVVLAVVFLVVSLVTGCAPSAHTVLGDTTQSGASVLTGRTIATQMEGVRFSVYRDDGLMFLFGDSALEVNREL